MRIVSHYGGDRCRKNDDDDNDDDEDSASLDVAVAVEESPADDV